MNPILISKWNAHPSKPARPLLLLLAGSAVIAGTLLGSSCATSRGFGQDVKKVGNKIENAATR